MRRSPRPAPAGRAGFTLVELLVATALTILVMAIMATAFQTGMDTLSQLKSVVGLSEQLRSAQNVLERDLSNGHLTDPSDSPVRVSSNMVTSTAWTSPSHGYLSILQGSMPTTTAGANYYQEGTEDGLTSSRATDHVLQLTVQLSGKSPQEAFFAPAPPLLAKMSGVSLVDYDPNGTQLVSRWAEVSYFLKQTTIQTVSDPTLGLQSLPMFTLYRRQRVLAPVQMQWDTTNWGSPYQYPDISTSTTVNGTTSTTYVNGPDSLTTAANRLGGANDATPPTMPWTGGLPYPIPFALSPSMPTTMNPYYGADVLLNNVLSFQVQVLCDLTVPNPTPPPATLTTQQFQFGDVTNSSGVWTGRYDTAQAATGKPRLKAIQIKLRVYDTKNKMTRQITINQDL
jgi:Tfp pilus assembly protein PilW